MKNFHTNIQLIIFCCFTILIFAFCGCANADNILNESSLTEQTSPSPAPTSSTASISTGEWDDTAATHITCSDTSFEIDGTGADTNANTLTINAAGTYVLSGTLSNGQIIVDAGDNDIIQLVLNGLDITCLNQSPISVSNAEEVTVTLAPDSINKITDDTEYVFASAEDDEPNATLFSKDDLIINGSGSLTVNANYYHGISSKDDLTITSGNITVNSIQDAVRGKDSLTIAGGNLTINAGDDALHTEQDLVIDGGNIQITACTEGLEGMTVTVNGGDINLTSSDDGINAAGSGSEGETTTNDTNISETNVDATKMKPGDVMSPGGGMDAATDYNSISITGGNLVIDANGDGIDTNGTLSISGGTTTILGPVNDGNGSIDYAGNFEITGGTLIAAGSSGMAQTPSTSSSQASLMVYFNSEQTAGTIYELLNDEDEIIASVTPTKKYKCVLVSTPSLVLNATYKISINGNSLCTVTPEEIITRISEDGSAIQRGGFGQFPRMGGGPGGKTGETISGNGMPPMGEMPPDGETPPSGEMPPDGEMPPSGETPTRTPRENN